MCFQETFSGRDLVGKGYEWKKDGGGLVEEFPSWKKEEKRERGIVQNAVFASCNLKCRVPARPLRR